MSRPVFHDYWRSSASYRVRIALNLCSIAFDTVPVGLLAGEHTAPPHLQRNPQGFVPVLAIAGECERLDAFRDADPDRWPH